MLIARLYPLKSLLIITLVLLSTLFATSTQAASAQEINTKVNATLQLFKSSIMGGEAFLDSAKGVLIFPEEIKSGFGVSGDYGEGALRINGQTRQFYGTTATSSGFEPDAQSKSIVLVFMTDKVLEDFLNRKDWKVGVDGAITLAAWNAAEDINTLDFKGSIVGFVFNNKGLMYNLSLEGSTFTRISR